MGFGFITENRLSHTWVPPNLEAQDNYGELRGWDPRQPPGPDPIALWFWNYSVWSASTQPALTGKGSLTVLVHSHRVWMQRAFGGFGLEPHNLGKYGSCLSFRETNCSKGNGVRIFLADGFPVLPGLDRHDHTFK
uniref:Uncharacterized protein n=1 Tax=Pipistrellus kuhlii TaxID=59472 RepID=A0A7J7RCC9_PIPKU|nr:hypothetical protein mPipKuh1_010696 [Pipistrellus kuhlii]